MNEIYKYRDEDGDEVEFLPKFAWQVANPKDFANTVAEMDYDQSNPDLHDPAHWPRTYEIWWENEWVEVSVDLEYMPCFSSKILGANSVIEQLAVFVRQIQLAV